MVTYVYMNRIRKNNLEKNETVIKKTKKDKKKMQSEDVARSQSVGGEGGAPC